MLLVKIISFCVCSFNKSGLISFVRMNILSSRWTFVPSNGHLFLLMDAFSFHWSSAVFSSNGRFLLSCVVRYVSSNGHFLRFIGRLISFLTEVTSLIERLFHLNSRWFHLIAACFS